MVTMTKEEWFVHYRADCGSCVEGPYDLDKALLRRRELDDELEGSGSVFLSGNREAEKS
jgi:hypothetical protein